MRSHKPFIVLLALLSIYQAAAQTKLIEKVVKKGNEVIIPYERYQLSNGLTIIVHEDHSDPIAYVEVTYHVGSARDPKGRSGFAHFFEHMMFQGSTHVADDQHYKMLSEAGGQVNGRTNRDQTQYLQLVPANQLETALWLESDRMGYLLDSVTQAKFEIQRATVKNERAQRVENQPYGLRIEKIAQGLYPAGHPYAKSTIGYIEDLNRADVNDLKKFFLRWYNPNNATLTVAGDVHTADVIKYAEKYFGPIPKGPDVKPQVVLPAVLTSDRYISYEDVNINAPQLGVWFPTVPARHPDEAPLDALAYIIGGNKTSIFEKNFVKSGLAQFSNVSHPTYELAGEWAINIRGFQETKLSVIDSLIPFTLGQFEKNGVTDEELKMFKANYEAPLVNSLSSVQVKGNTLATNQIFTGDPNYIVKDLKRYRNVTKEDVMRVYKKYIKNKPAVYLSIYPKGKPYLISKPNNYKIPEYDSNTPEPAEYKNLVYNKPPDTFDRSIRPPVPAIRTVKVPDFWTESFHNRMKIIGTVSNELPIITIQLNLEAGHRYEPKEQAGIAQLLTDMLGESTEKYTSEQISSKLDLLGSTIAIDHDGQDIVLTINTFTKNLDATLAIAEEILFHPRFDAQDFARVKKQNLVAIDNMSTRVSTLANNIYANLLYGNDHIMSIPALGTKETVSALTLDDVKKYYTNRITPYRSSLVIVGDLNKELILPKLTAFKNWTGNTRMHEREPVLPVIDKTRIYFVNKERAAQSEIRIGYMALPFDATDVYFKAGIMNYVLGEFLTSRLNINLRETHGYTYGARSGFSGNQFIGPFTATAGVRTDVTDKSVVEFMNEIKNYADKGITEQELTFTKSAIAQNEALRYETPIQKAGFIKRIMDYGLEKDYTIQQSEILKTITVEEVNEIAKKYLPYMAMNILVVGDKAQVFDKLKGLGYEVVELDVNGDPKAD